MFSSISRTTFRSPVLARAYAGGQSSKGVLSSLKDKVLGGAEQVDAKTGASDKAEELKSEAKSTADGLRSVAEPHVANAKQVGGQVKQAMSNAASKVTPDLESQQPSQADVPPELRSDPYAGEKADKVLKEQGKDLRTTDKKGGYSGNMLTANPLVSGTGGGALDGGSSR